MNSNPCKLYLLCALSLVFQLRPDIDQNLPDQGSHHADTPPTIEQIRKPDQTTKNESPASTYNAEKSSSNTLDPASLLNNQPPTKKTVPVSDSVPSVPVQQPTSITPPSSPLQSNVINQKTTLSSTNKPCTNKKPIAQKPTSLKNNLGDPHNNKNIPYNPQMYRYSRNFQQGQKGWVQNFIDGIYAIKDAFKNSTLECSGYIAVGIVVLVSSYCSSRLLWAMLHKKFTKQKPRVIIKSSETMAPNFMRRALSWFRTETTQSRLAHMVFSPELKKRLFELLSITKTITKRIKAGTPGIKFRNLLLYGPPGTGKTMFAELLAQELAKESEMKFVVTTGSSFLQPGAGIEAIDELFEWTAKSNSGLCIFIDEADSLFANRETINQDSERYKIINHFLNYLGQRSNKFMVILATNYPVVFDSAMQRRIDDVIEFTLPQEQERFRALQLYRDIVLLHEREKHEVAYVKALGSHFSDEKLLGIAKRLKGFSYSDIAGIVNNLYSDTMITKGGVLTAELVEQVVKRYLEKKRAFQADGKACERPVNAKHIETTA